MPPQVKVRETKADGNLTSNESSSANSNDKKGKRSFNNRNSTHTSVTQSSKSHAYVNSRAIATKHKGSPSSSSSPSSSNSFASSPETSSSSIDFIGISLLLVVVIISVVSYTLTNGGNSNVDWGNVFYYAWLTAVSTGVGALPFYFIRSLDEYFVGISNAIAGGMMLSASYSLVVEGSNIDEGDK